MHYHSIVYQQELHGRYCEESNSDFFRRTCGSAGRMHPGTRLRGPLSLWCLHCYKQARSKGGWGIKGLEGLYYTT
ncbi:hypothetical protein VTL71DRAFT_6456 [Oculimacula yallundae]|uniref:Uncharacterized protein n=1 Tax=Oculimacula yallundae TaxID=86028 RepID=A0ABR4BX12_9HELO